MKKRTPHAPTKPNLKMVLKPKVSPRRALHVLPSLPNTFPGPTAARQSSQYPSLPGAPLTPEVALKQYIGIMTDREKTEIKEYRDIFYIRQGKPSPQSHMVYDADFWPFVLNDHIQYRYQQLCELGRGAFGTAIKCFDHKTQLCVALKVERELPSLKKQIDQEKEVIQVLMARDSSSAHHIVKILDMFTYRGYVVYVSEVLSVDLYLGMKANKFAGIGLPKSQIVVRQMADAIAYMHNLGLIHCDVKPENILWTGSRKTSVKLIDFGSCCYASRPMYTYIQSRFYRAPEVILRLDYGKEIDIWSLGCVICEVITGRPIFGGQSEEEQMQLFVSVLGMPPESMIADSPQRDQYFDKDGRLKKPCVPGSKPLSSIVTVDDPLLMSLIQQCLMWDPAKRIKANQVARHPWMKSSVVTL